MKLKTNSIIQILSLVIGGLAQFTPILPPKAQGYAVGAAGLLTIGVQAVQAVSGIIAHMSDTQGHPLPPTPPDTGSTKAFSSAA